MMFLSTLGILLIGHIIATSSDVMEQDASGVAFFDLVESDGLATIQGYLDDHSSQDGNIRNFAVSLSSSLVRLRFTPVEGYMRDIMLMPSGGRESPIRIDRSQTSAFDSNWRQLQNSLGVGLHSDFGRCVGSMMLLPVNPGIFGSAVRMIVSPTDPLVYCADRQLTMIDIVGNADGEDRFEVEVAASARLSESSTIVSPFILVLAELTILPIPIYEYVRNEARRIGMIETSLNEYQEGCANLIDLLPLLRFVLRSSDGRPAITIFFSGRDYVSVNETNGSRTCHLQIQGDEYYASLGRNFLERVAVFFDYTNHRLGFCDPW